MSHTNNNNSNENMKYLNVVCKLLNNQRNFRTGFYTCFIPILLSRCCMLRYSYLFVFIGGR